MKKLLVSLLLCGLMLSLVACDNSPSSTSSSAGDSSLATESIVSNPEESLPDESGESSDLEESSITGTIKEVADDAITLELEDGTQLSIPTADVDTSELTDGLKADASVTVYYTGIIEDTDTSQIIVSRIIPAE